MKTACFACLLLFAASLFAQSQLPAGTLIPVMLNTGLHAPHLKPGQPVRARVMQDVPGTAIHRGAKVVGRVVSVSPTHLEVRFDTVVAHGRRIPIRADLRALASMMEVEQARIPEGGADRALPPYLRNRTQIGGDDVYRMDGPVAHGMDIVGEPVWDGVVGQARSQPPCRAAVGSNSGKQAFWLFSTNACGLYGFENLKLEHAGRTAPTGIIRLTGPAGKLNIRSGSGLLLRVQG